MRIILFIVYNDYKIKKNLNDKSFRSNLIKNANIHFKKFSWEDSIYKTLNVIESV